MGRKETITRRAALAMIGGGAALLTGQTFGYTKTTVGRQSSIDASSDPNALLGITGLPGCDDGEITIRNNSDNDFTATVDTDAIAVTRPSSGKSVSFSLSPTDEQVVTFTPDTDTVDAVDISASSPEKDIHLTRRVTLTPIAPAIYRLEAKHSGWEMGVKNSKSDVKQYDYTKPNVRTDWEFVLNDDCTYRIRNDAVGGVLSVQDATANGSTLVREAWDPMKQEQRWTVLPNDDGTFRIRNLFSGQVVDVSDASGKTGATVLQWPWKGEGSDDNQSWNVTRTGFSGSTGFETVDTTGSQNATFDASTLQIIAGGRDMYETPGGNYDEYGAIVDEGVTGAAVAETRVVQQDDTGEWAKAGLMFANEASAEGGSIGDVKVDVTPRNGFEMTWDGNANGYHETGSADGSSSIPCDLRLEKTAVASGYEFVGAYKRDGDSNWTEIDRVTISSANTTQDVALINCAYDTQQRSTVEFDSFSVQ